MRALLTLWWWEWVTSVHEHLHVKREALWDTYRPERGSETVPDIETFSLMSLGESGNITVTYESDGNG